MSKNREHITKSIREKVMREFNHRCAICGEDRPQLHHIDEDPSNNDPMNLIPLCPNCHLIDQHNPTQPIEPAKLQLFRNYKDPNILKPQFHPLFVRMRFLDSIDENSSADELAHKAQELIEFVEALEMGTFYSKRLAELINKPRSASAFVPGDPASVQRHRLRAQRRNRQYCEMLNRNRDPVQALVVELLRFQSWQ
jgi:hypothetical protein